MVEKYLNSRLITLYLLPLLLGSLTVFSFQPFNFTIINFIILPIFFYLLIFIKKKSKGTYRKKPYKKNLFLFGSVFGFGYYFSGIHWINYSLTFDQSFQILIPFGLILIPLFLSLFFSITILIVGPLLNLNFKSLFLLSAGFATSDYLRSKILSGFPWNLWSYSFSWATEILQLLNLIGLFAFNLLIISIFMLPAVIFFRIKFIKKIIYLFLLPFILFILFIYGSHTINHNKVSNETLNKKSYIKVISPNFSLKYGLTDEEIQNRLKKLIKYSDPKNDKKTVFVWPEGVFSGYTYKELLLLRELFSKSFSTDHYILFGINRASKETGGVFNSIVVVNNQLEIIQEYNKQKLVPFGEFLPFEKFLKKFGLKKITEGHGSFLKGEDQKNLLFNNLNILPLICYEIIFTKFVQNSSLETNLIVNISEDAWFGKSIGPHQHFAKGIFRAIEQNSYLIRSANRGISVIINNKGEVIKKLKPRETGNIDLEVPLITTDKKNKNDLIFFSLLFTYIFIFYFYKKKNEKK